jgi:hypothetical protein
MMNKEYTSQTMASSFQIFGLQNLFNIANPHPQPKMNADSLIQAMSKHAHPNPALMMSMINQMSRALDDVKKMVSSFEAAPAVTSSEISQRSLPAEKKRNWTAEEDKTILRLVAEKGRNWTLIAGQLKNRTGKQVRDRYINHVDPNISKLKWTSEEDDRLLELYGKHGPKWTLISQHLTGRPENAIKNRFHNFLSKKLEPEAGKMRKKKNPCLPTRGNLNLGMEKSYTVPIEGDDSNSGILPTESKTLSMADEAPPVYINHNRLISRQRSDSQDSISFYLNLRSVEDSTKPVPEDDIPFQGTASLEQDPSLDFDSNVYKQDLPGNFQTVSDLFLDFH